MGKHDNKPTFAGTPQVLDLQRLAGNAFTKMPKSIANQILATNASQKAFMRKLAKLWDESTQSEEVSNAISTLIDYYQKVYGIDISEISDMAFPEHDTFKTYMAVSPQLDEDRIMMSLREYFKINLYRYKEPVASNINRDEEARIQKRPSGLYVFAHLNGDEPDANHRNKSYDDAVAANMTFATAKEYLLIWGYKKFTENKYMDTAGWTRTASLWSDGSLVRGGWDSGDSRLCLDNGRRGSRSSDNGPRELFLNL